MDIHVGWGSSTDIAQATKKDQMAVISERFAYVYVLAPRTACTSIGIELVRHFAGEWLPSEDFKSAEGDLLVPRKHSTLHQLMANDLLTPSARAKKLVFTAVRNPFDSLVSLWLKQATAYQHLLDDPDSFIHHQPGFKQGVIFARDHSFPEWVRYRFEDRVANGPRHMYQPFIQGADVIMRYENLQDDFNQVLRRVGASAEGHRIPMLNETVGRAADYRVYYNDYSRDLIGEIFAKDLERFGYSF